MIKHKRELGKHIRKLEKDVKNIRRNKLSKDDLLRCFSKNERHKLAVFKRKKLCYTISRLRGIKQFFIPL